MGKLCYMVQIRVCRQFDDNLSLVLLLNFSFYFRHLLGRNAVADAGYRQP